MKSKTQLIVPVPMAGGTGTRLWPLSRETYPKQFLALRGEKTPFQQTVLRTADRMRFANPIVVVNNEHRFIARGQLGEMGVNATIIVEPVGRNTAPAAAVAAALHAQEHDAGALILLMPADHVIQDGAALTDALRAGAHAPKGYRAVRHQSRAPRAEGRRGGARRFGGRRARPAAHRSAAKSARRILTMTFKVARCASILPFARGMLAAFACFALTLPAIAADEAYRLSPGDTIEIAAAGVPELRDKAQINVDGNVSLPLIGQLHVAGMPISEVREKIGKILPTKEFRLHTPDGREYPVIISPDQISVRIVEYRPVYLTGDVAKPGEEAYRPGLTIRQAVALAGGYDIMRFRMENPFLQLPELRGEYNSLWMEFAEQQANIARIKAALAGKTDIDFSGVAKTPIPQQLASTINRLATDELAARTTNLQNEKTFLKQAKAKEEGRVGTLTQLKQKEDEGTNAETADLKRLQGLFAKGAVPITRVEEARRAILLSSTRYLETIAQIAQVERERDKVGRQYARLDEERRVQLLGNLQDANVKLAQTRARLQAVSDKLVYTGMVRSQLVNGEGGKPILTIYRQGPNGTTRTKADEDTRLLPGDTVEVVLRQPGQGDGDTAVTR